MSVSDLPPALAPVSHRAMTAQSRAETALPERAATLRLAMRGANMGLWDRDLPDRAYDWSPEFEALLGLDAGGLRRSFEEFIKLVQPEDRNALEGTISAAIDQRSGFHVELRFRHTSGEWRWMDVRGQVVCDERGEPAHLCGSGVDVTLRKRAEEARVLLAAIVESSDDAIVSKTLDGRVTSWNAGAARLFGYSAAEIIGQPITTIIPRERHGEEVEILAKLRRGERIEHFETVRVAKDGHRVEVSLTTSPIRDSTGRVVGASKVARDISARKRADEERREAERHKDEFLAMLGHELRNPLAPIRTASAVLRRTSHGNQTQEQMCTVLDRQLQQMTRLLDDLLDVSRITQGKIQFRREPVDLLTVVARAVETSRPLIDARRHRLSVSLPEESLRVEGDQARLVQMLANILNNAAKYTAEGGRICVAVQSDAPTVELRVQDTGIGMAPEILPRIFDMFVQADQTLDRSQGGLGIGLTLVRSIVEQHGGQVAASSAGVGHGSEFVVRLPLLDESRMGKHEDGAIDDPLPRTSARKRILVVDDNRDAAESMAILLRLAGHEVITAVDGLAAIDVVHTHRPELVLMDIGLPGMSGYEVARRLRDDGCAARLIAVTGYGQAEDQKRARDAGFDHCFVKPVEPEALERLVAQ